MSVELDHHSLVSCFLEENHQTGERYKTDTFPEFLEKFITASPDQQRFFFQTPAKLIHTILTTPPPIPHLSGIPEYPFFTQRQDNLDIFGVKPALHELVKVFDAFAKSSLGFQKMLVLVAPSGAGKSTIIEAIKAGLENHPHQEYLYVIDGCPINENPFHLLGPRSRETVREQFHLNITGELCPDCQKRLEENHSLYPSFRVTKLHLSAKMGRGVVKIEPKHTLVSDSDLWSVVTPMILQSNRGILEIAEFCHQNPKFFKGILDLLRGRRIQYHSKTYELENIIIGHTTYQEWQKFQKEDGISALLERIEPILIPFNLSLSDEARIYEKYLKNSGFTNTHRSPYSLQSLAGIAIRSRLTPPSSNSPFTTEDKISLYDGQETDNASFQNLPKLLEEGRKNNEGSDGLSPELINSMMFQVLLDHPDCLKAIDVFVKLHSFVNEKLDSILPKRGKILEAIALEKDRVLKLLLGDVYKALRDKYDEACQKLFEEYIRNCDLFLNDSTELNPITRELEGANSKFLAEVEDAAFKSALTSEERRHFRFETLIKHQGNLRKGQSSAYDSFLKLRQGLQKIVLGETEDPSEVIREATNPNSHYRERIQETIETLIRRHNYCSKCAPEIIAYLSKLLNNK